MSNPDLVPVLLEKICDQLVSLNDKTDINTQQLVSLNERVDGLNERVDGLNERVDANTQQLVSLNERVDGLNERVEKLDGTVTQMRADYRELYTFAQESRRRITRAATMFEHRAKRFDTQLKGLEQAILIAADKEGLTRRLDKHEQRIDALERSRPGGSP